MRAVLLDGSVREEMAPARGAAEAYLKERGYQVETVKLRDKEIDDCTGCFGCWVRTPGECVNEDDANEVSKLFVASDLVVFLSPIVFGGYSYHLKKALDRSICFALPFFQKVDGEIHHPRRYKTKQTLVVIGLLPQRNEEAQRVFQNLAERNSRNLQPVSWSSALVFGDESSEMTAIAVKEALIKAGVKE